MYPEKEHQGLVENDQSTADLFMLTLTLCGAGVYLGIETCMLRIAGPIHPHRHIRQYEAGRPAAKSREDRQVAVKNPAWISGYALPDNCEHHGKALPAGIALFSVLVVLPFRKISLTEVLKKATIVTQSLGNTLPSGAHDERQQFTE